MEHLHHTQKETNYSPEELLQKYKESGHLDLRSATEAERKKILEWYLANFDSLEKNDQTEILEQGIAYGAVDDQKAVTCLRHMEAEERAKLGLFIMQTQEPSRYPYAFHEYWLDLPEETQKKFKKTVTAENTTHGLMLAPFIDLAYTTDRAEELDEKKSKEKKSFKSYQETIETAPKIIESLIDYWHHHPEERALEEKFRLNGAQRQSPVLIQRNIDYFRQSNVCLLIPYLTQLEEEGLCTPSEITALLIKAKEQGYFSYGQFITTEEKEKRKKILNEHGMGSEATGDNISYTPYIIEGHPKDKHALEDISDAVLIRGTYYIFEHFNEQKPYLGTDTVSYLEKYLEEDYPIFIAIEKLALSKEEVLRLLTQTDFPFKLANLQDLKAVLTYNKKHAAEPGPDLEPAVVRAILKSVDAANQGPYFNGWLLFHIEEAASWFTPKAWEKIKKSITKLAPELWLENIPFVLKEKIIDFDNVLTLLAGKEDDFLDTLPQLIQFLEEMHTDQAERTNQERKIQSITKKILTKNPDYFVHQQYAAIVDSLFTPDEQKQFISDHLKPPVEAEFIYRLLDNPRGKPYTERCTEVLRETPALFISMIEHYLYYETITELLDWGTIADLLIKSLGDINISELERTIFRRNGFLSHLARSEEQCDNFLNSLQQTEQLHFLPELLKNIASATHKSSTSDSDQEKYSRWQSKKQSLERDLGWRIDDLNRRHEALARTRDAVLIERITTLLDDIQESIAKINKEIALLAKNEPARPEELPEKERHALKMFQEKIIAMVKHACEQDPFFIYTEGVASIHALDPKPFIRETIDEYSTLYPEVILLEGWRPDQKNTVFCLEAIGPERFNRLLQKHARYLAFSKEVLDHAPSEALTPKFVDQLKTINPLFDLHNQTELPDDYYQLIIERLEENPFFSLYETELKRMASEENKVYGKRTNVKYYEANQNFIQLTKRLALLNACPWARRNASSLFILPEDEREEIIGLIEHAAINNLDTDLTINLDVNNIFEVRDELIRRVSAFTEKLFEVTSHDNEPIGFAINIETIQALGIYYRRSCQKHPGMRHSFQHFITQVLRGNYYTWRGWNSEHVPNEQEKPKRLTEYKQAGLLPSELTLKQYEEWLHDEESNFEEVFTYQVRDIQNGIRDTLAQALVDRHVTADEIHMNQEALHNRYQKLVEDLQVLTERQGQLKKRFTEARKNKGDATFAITEAENTEYETIKQALAEYQEKHGDELARLQALNYLEKIKHISAKEIEDELLIIDDKKSTIKLSRVFETLEKTFAENTDFKQDLDRIKKIIIQGRERLFGGEKISRSRLTITDRVDTTTYTFIGERPVKSCQNYNGTDLNYGLLSYLTDPNVKIIQLYDERNQIIARSIMRLLEDRDGKPHIFIERIYSSNNHHKIKEAIINFAKRKGEKIGVSVHSEEIEQVLEEKLEQEAPSEPLQLYSRGSRNPYVYTDAGGGKIPRGQYTITTL